MISITSEEDSRFHSQQYQYNINNYLGKFDTERITSSFPQCPINSHGLILPIQGKNQEHSLVFPNSHCSLPLISVKAIAARRSGFRKMNKEKSRIEIVPHVFGNIKGMFERNCSFYGLMDTIPFWHEGFKTFSVKEINQNNFDQLINLKAIQINKRSDESDTQNQFGYHQQENGFLQSNTLQKQVNKLKLEGKQRKQIIDGNQNLVQKKVKFNNSFEKDTPNFERDDFRKESLKMALIQTNQYEQQLSSTQQKLHSTPTPLQNSNFYIQRNLSEQKTNNLDQQTKALAKLSELILNPVQMHEAVTQNAVKTLQQCVSVTSAGVAHSTFSQFLSDFNATSIESARQELNIDEDTHTQLYQEDDIHISNKSPSNSINLLHPQQQQQQCLAKTVSSSTICSFQNELTPTLGDFPKGKFATSLKTVSSAPQRNMKNRHNSAELKSSENFQKSFVNQCKSAFTLKALSSSQLSQFRFAQYKKKNSTCPEQPGKVSKFGKYHNFNKLFMYNILNMFQPNNLVSLEIPELISKELQLLISRIKISAKNNYKVEGKYAFDYFSHAHYNILFLSITNDNLSSLRSQPEIVNLYSTCFNVDIRIPLPPVTVAYMNIIKLFCYRIFFDCICEGSIQSDDSLTQENLKNLYTLKVIKGIKKLSQGIIIKRF